MVKISRLKESEMLKSKKFDVVGRSSMIEKYIPIMRVSETPADIPMIK